MHLTRVAGRALAWGVLALATVGSAEADVITFGQFKLDPGSTRNVQNPFYLDSGSTGSTLGVRPNLDNVNQVDVLFSFLNVGGGSIPAGDVPATLTMTVGSNSQAVAFPDGFTLSQLFANDVSVPDGEILITRKSDDTVLLRAEFRRVSLSGVDDGDSAALLGATPRSTITFYSDYLLFNQAGRKALSLSFTSLNPSLAIQDFGGMDFLRDFTASGTGSFSADVSGVVPEPSSAALLVLGVLMLARPGRLLASA